MTLLNLHTVKINTKNASEGILLIYSFKNRILVNEVNFITTTTLLFLLVSKLHDEEFGAKNEEKKNKKL